jgi:LemA protein
MRLEAEQQLGQSINAVLSIAESYPELKASAHFRELSQQLADSENRVTASRRFYNLAVEEYNTAIRQFPGSRIAQYRRLGTRQPFDLGIERVILDEPVAIRF